MSGTQNIGVRSTHKDQTDLMVKSQVFEVSLRGSHSLIIPESHAFPFVEKGHGRVRVQARFEGKAIDFHAALQKYQGQFVITFGRRYQKELGIYPNDYFELQLFEDNSRYGVEMPEELEVVLQSDPEAKQVFESFTAGKIRSLIYVIARYKNSQTRIDKSIILTENLKRGIRDPRELFRSV